MNAPRRAAETRRIRATRRVKTLWLVGSITVVLGGYGGMAGLAWVFQAGAHEFGERARHEFPGDQVDALIGLVQSEHHALAERNHAVHALAQIGSARALPVLMRHYTGHECQHSKFLCQYELRKAIDRCSGRNWAPAWWPFFPRPPLRSGA
jgi:hypothetical protein